MTPIKSKRAAKHAKVDKPPETTRDKLDRLRRRVRSFEVPEASVQVTVREQPLREMTVVEVPSHAWSQNTYDSVEIELPGLGYSGDLIKVVVALAVRNYKRGFAAGRSNVQDQVLHAMGVQSVGENVKDLSDKVDKLTERLDRVTPGGN